MCPNLPHCIAFSTRSAFGICATHCILISGFLYSLVCGHCIILIDEFYRSCSFSPSLEKVGVEAFRRGRHPFISDSLRATCDSRFHRFFGLGPRSRQGNRIFFTGQLGKKAVGEISMTDWLSPHLAEVCWVVGRP